MLARIRDFFNNNLAVSDDPSHTLSERSLHLATAALLIEVSRADFDLDDKEREAVVRAMRETFQLDSATIDELIKLADQELDQSASLYQFTRLVNDYYSYEQKVELLSTMWQIAYADGIIDKYEEHLIRKVAELIHVRHKDFIRAKLAHAPVHRKS